MVGINFKNLISIAATGGNEALIDTQEEQEKTWNLLNSSLENENLSDRERQLMTETLATLTSNPDTPLQINFSVFDDLPVCSTSTQDCERLLIPVPSQQEWVFPISSGGLFADHIDYVPVSKELWNGIVSPLVEDPPQNPEDERRLISKVVRNFYLKTAQQANSVTNQREDEYWRGKQNCKDKGNNLKSLFNVLSAGNYLKFHSFDPDKTGAGSEKFHYAALILENGANYFAIDISLHDVTMMRLEEWERLFADPSHRIYLQPKL